MTTDRHSVESTTLSPDDAFNVLGDQTRLQILQALGEAGEPLAFSEVFDRIGYDDYTNFGYHLRKLVGHFVRQTDAGYELRRSGHYVVQSILSGAVTDGPVIERTDVEWSCLFCGSPAEMSYREGAVLLFCSQCEGLMGHSRAAAKRWAIDEPLDDIIGYVGLPPAGVYDRSPTEVLESAEIWSVADIQPLARGVCPGCSAAIEQSARVCEDHAVEDGVCDRCDHRFGVSVVTSCTNCIFDAAPPFVTVALGDTDLMGFMIDHDLDPMAPRAFHKTAGEEEIVSTDPLEAKYTFTIDDESITLTVDENLETISVHRSRTPDSEGRNP